MSKKDILWAAVVGILATFVPFLSNWAYAGLWPLMLMLIPGFVVNVMLTGNAHDMTFAIILPANAIIYGVLTIAFLRVRARLRSTTPGA